MNRFLLIENKAFFNRHGVHTVSPYKAKFTVPHRNAIIFFGDHHRELRVKTNKLGQAYLRDVLNRLAAMPYKYAIIMCKSDKSFPRLSLPPNVVHVFATNVTYPIDKVRFLPMGCDFRSLASYRDADILNTKRDILCYCNFSLDTHPVRQKIYDILKHKPFVTSENMQTFGDYSISRDEFFERLGRSKFVVCPRGAGIDTFRFYDAIYAGAIPIVVRVPFHNTHHFEGVPVLYLDSPDGFEDLTEEYLNEQYTVLSCHRKRVYKGLDFGAFMRTLKQELGL
jgi:hypothetical protein